MFGDHRNHRKLIDKEKTQNVHDAGAESISFRCRKLATISGTLGVSYDFINEQIDIRDFLGFCLQSSSLFWLF